MSVERELAVHQTEIKHLQADMDSLVADMESIKTTLNAINSTLAEARGGWKVLMMVGGAGGALGAVVTQFAHKLFGQETKMAKAKKTVDTTEAEVKDEKTVEETGVVTEDQPDPNRAHSWFMAKAE